MKTTVIPAQITSIEDTIAANLSLTQVVLLILPVFIAAFTFALLPPFMRLSAYKLGLITVISLPLVSLAIRIRGQVAFKLLIIVLTFKCRSHIYLLANRSNCSCDQSVPKEQKEVEAKTSNLPLSPLQIKVTPKQMLSLEAALSSRRVQFFTNSEGKLNANIESK